MTAFLGRRLTPFETALFSACLEEILQLEMMERDPATNMSED